MDSMLSGWWDRLKPWRVAACTPAVTTKMGPATTPAPSSRRVDVVDGPVLVVILLVLFVMVESFHAVWRRCWIRVVRRSLPRQPTSFVLDTHPPKIPTQVPKKILLTDVENRHRRST
ncbi:MAG TPA: hypothetical protein VES60_07500 [Nakamurella sp.]|nr:hypothetical protein [Nakamurella sp.]